MNPAHFHSQAIQSTQNGIDLYVVYRSLLCIVADLEKSQYTAVQDSQTAVSSDDLANPARDKSTAQG
jgi:hypothetical protein